MFLSLILDFSIHWIICGKCDDRKRKELTLIESITKVWYSLFQRRNSKIWMTRFCERRKVETNNNKKKYIFFHFSTTSVSFDACRSHIWISTTVFLATTKTKKRICVKNLTNRRDHKCLSHSATVTTHECFTIYFFSSYSFDLEIQLKFSVVIERLVVCWLTDVHDNDFQFNEEKKIEVSRKLRKKIDFNCRSYSQNDFLFRFPSRTILTMYDDVSLSIFSRI